MRVKQEILQLKLPVSIGAYEFEIRESEGLSIIGENGSGKSELLYKIANKGKGVGYRGNRGRLTKDEKSLFEAEIGYFDGTKDELDDELVIDLIERASVKFKMPPISIASIFDIDETEYMQKVKQTKGFLAHAVALLFELCKERKLLIIDDVFGLDYEFKRKLIPFLEKVREEKGLTYLVATNDLEMAKRLTEYVMIIENKVPVEYARTETFFKKPLHPYTKWFTMQKKKGQNQVVFIRTEKDGKPPKRACKFSIVCPFSDDICKSKQCEFSLHGRDHWVSCHKA